MSTTKSKEIREEKKRDKRTEEKRREEKMNRERRRVENKQQRRKDQKIKENRREEKEEKIDCVKERVFILKRFNQKNMFKHTLNHRINFIEKFNDIFEKKQLS